MFDSEYPPQLIYRPRPCSAARRFFGKKPVDAISAANSSTRNTTRGAASTTTAASATTTTTTTTTGRSSSHFSPQNKQVTAASPRLACRILDAYPLSVSQSSLNWTTQAPSRLSSSAADIQKSGRSIDDSDDGDFRMRPSTTATTAQNPRRSGSRADDDGDSDDPTDNQKLSPSPQRKENNNNNNNSPRLMTSFSVEEVAEIVNAALRQAGRRPLFPPSSLPSQGERQQQQPNQNQNQNQESSSSTTASPAMGGPGGINCQVGNNSSSSMHPAMAAAAPHQHQHAAVRLQKRFDGMFLRRLPALAANADALADVDVIIQTVLDFDEKKAANDPRAILNLLNENIEKRDRLQQQHHQELNSGRSARRATAAPAADASSTKTTKNNSNGLLPRRPNTQRPQTTATTTSSSSSARPQRQQQDPDDAEERMLAAARLELGLTTKNKTSSNNKNNTVDDEKDERELSVKSHDENNSGDGTSNIKQGARDTFKGRSGHRLRRLKSSYSSSHAVSPEKSMRRPSALSFDHHGEDAVGAAPAAESSIAAAAASSVPRNRLAPTVSRSGTSLQRQMTSRPAQRSGMAAYIAAEHDEGGVRRKKNDFDESGSLRVNDVAAAAAASSSLSFSSPASLSSFTTFAQDEQQQQQFLQQQLSQSRNERSFLQKTQRLLAATSTAAQNLILFREMMENQLTCPHCLGLIHDPCIFVVCGHSACRRCCLQMRVSVAEDEAQKKEEKKGKNKKKLPTTAASYSGKQIKKSADADEDNDDAASDNSGDRCYASDALSASRIAELKQRNMKRKNNNKGTNGRRWKGADGIDEDEEILVGEDDDEEQEKDDDGADNSSNNDAIDLSLVSRGVAIEIFPERRDGNYNRYDAFHLQQQQQQQSSAQVVLYRCPVCKLVSHEGFVANHSLSHIRARFNVHTKGVQPPEKTLEAFADAVSKIQQQNRDSVG